MTTPGEIPGSGVIELLPHQERFVLSALLPELARIVVLRGDPGLGKNVAVIELVARKLRQSVESRVLFLLPAALREQAVWKVRALGSPAVAVDRYRLRELLEASGAESPWPAGIALVMSFEFSMQPDVLQSLESVPWDLVVVDEAHLLRGKRAVSLSRLSAKAKRIVLVTLRNADLRLPPSEEAPAIVEWSLETLLNFDGQPLLAGEDVTLEEVRYQLSNALHGVNTSVQQFGYFAGQDRAKNDGWFRYLEGLLLSSPAALEKGLQSLSARVAKELSGSPSRRDDEVPDLEEFPAGNLSSDESREATRLIENALRSLEAVEEDRKLMVLRKLLDGLEVRGGRLPKTCVLTAYESTLYYIAAELEDSGLPFRLAHGRMPTEERKRAAEDFAASGGILLATYASISDGASWGAVRDLVLYDTAVGREILQEAAGRFLTVGRQEPLTIHVFAEGSAGGPNEAIQTLRAYLGIATRSSAATARSNSSPIPPPRVAATAVGAGNDQARTLELGSNFPEAPFRRSCVAFLDILGFKGIWRRAEPKRILENLEMLEKTVRKDFDELVVNQAAVGLPIELDLRFLSDSLIFIVALRAPVPGEEPPTRELLRIVEGRTVLIASLLAAVAQVKAAQFDTPFALRGCISLGELAVSGNFLVGQAIDEAAEGERWADAAVVWLTEGAAAALEADLTPSSELVDPLHSDIEAGTTTLEIEGHEAEKRSARVVVPFAVPRMDEQLFLRQVEASFAGASGRIDVQEKLRKTLSAYRAMLLVRDDGEV